jgi:hypothetical protein
MLDLYSADLSLVGLLCLDPENEAAGIFKNLLGSV